jgi:hypothetical protein
MKKCTVLALSLVFILCMVAAGCTKPAAQPPLPIPATPAATLTPPPTASAAPAQSCSLTPGPTQQPPAYESVSISVDRNTITENPTITTSFNGGQGLGMVQSMTVTVIHPDCTQQQQVRKSPGMGTSVTMMGTTMTDRVIVSVVMTSGDQYTVIDKDYPFAPKI